MVQVNMFEAKSNLSSLVMNLESHNEGVIYITRNGKLIIMMTLIPPMEITSRFGVAEGVFTVPDDFCDWDREIEDMFGDRL